MKPTPGNWIYAHADSPEARFISTVGYCGEFVFGTQSQYEGGYYDDHGDCEADARLCATAPELLHTLAEATGMLSACMEILSGRMRASNNAATEAREQHAKCIALLCRVAPKEKP